MSLDETKTNFNAMGLDDLLLKALYEVGYENPTPIQAQCIPHLLDGRDLVGQAQTGTGKTAAFALPLLSRIDLKRIVPQVLVLTPTRELAIQVCEAMQSYARHLPGFHIAPIYGGQSYDIQNRHLRRGVHVIVGTPGRVMDHIRRKTLSLDYLKALVLDEGDEMLRMGFIDDVEWILEQVPATKPQIALFSATMPTEIRKVSQRYLVDPVEINIREKTTTAATIRQRYWEVSGVNKLDALTRILEVETFEAVLIFVRTKNATVELAEKLAARGLSCEALNGDIPQQGRERIIDRLRRGTLEVLVATDVAARGLDVEKISLVVNYDIPYDTESYVHRIGRTGRAGHHGDAILFVAPRERRMLALIERATRQPLERMALPTARDINQQRMVRFKQRIGDAIESLDLSSYETLIQEYQAESGHDMPRIAAALAALEQGDEPLLLNEKSDARLLQTFAQDSSASSDDRRRNKKERRSERPNDARDIPMERFRIEVGYQHGVKPGNIVGAIANEADLDSRYIGQIEITNDYSLIDLPMGMDDDTLRLLRKTRVCGVPMLIARLTDLPPERPAKASRTRTEQPSTPDRKPRADRQPREARADHQPREARADRKPQAERRERSPRKTAASLQILQPSSPPTPAREQGPQIDRPMKKKAPQGNKPSLNEADEPIAELIRSFVAPSKAGKGKKSH